jgi:hypothetical protein
MPKKVSNTTKKTVAAVETAQAVTAVKEVKPKTVVDSIASLQLSLPAELGKVGNEIVNLLNTRDNLIVTINEHERRLKEIHDIEAQAVNLDELKSEIEAQRAAWEDEKERLEAIRDQEDEDYINTINRKYAKLEQDLSDKIDAAKRSEKLRAETLAADWANRETALKSREVEIKELVAKVDAFDVTLKKEVDKQVAIATSALKKEYEHQAALVAKDRDSDKKLAEATIMSLREHVSRLQVDLDKARTDLKAAHESVVSVAGESARASSGRAALDAVQSTLANQNVVSNRK